MAFEFERERVVWALEAAETMLPPDTSASPIPQAELWILALGFSNAFYSITETLRRIDKQAHPLAHQVYGEWLAAGGRERIADFNNEFRRVLTHQGKFTLQAVSVLLPQTEEESYVIHQTSFAPEGMALRTFTFREWTLYCFRWLDDELARLALIHDERSSGLSETEWGIDAGWE